MINSSSPTLSRREALKLVATASVAAVVGAGTLTAQSSKGSTGSTGLPKEIAPLPYAYDALEPHIDSETMRIHHDRHHASYLSAARKLLEPHPRLLGMPPEQVLANLDQVPGDIRTGVRNQLGGHVNHAFFWEILAPNREYRPGPLQQALGRTFGGIDSFKQAFKDAALGRFGSGWAWLSVDRKGELKVHSTANQDSPLMEGLRPIIGLDVWEHAYYLLRQNRRGDYVDAFWNVLNWDRVETHYRAA